MERFLKDNILCVLIVMVLVAGGLYGTYVLGSNYYDSLMNANAKKEDVRTKESKLEQLKQQKMAQEAKKKKEAGSGKVIYEVLGQQFSPEASFGIMFENILSNITNSGVRIRSIDYNYQPQEDKIATTNIQGYNACELSFTTISSYSQLQSFFKSLVKESYLTNIYEVYIEPYDKDKTILIAKFKVRLYTKTI